LYPLRYKTFDTLEEIITESHKCLKGPNVALSGGGTYAKLFAGWASLGNLAHINFFPVDERQVEFENNGCNWKVTYDRLLMPMGLFSQRGHHARSKIQYEKLLKDHFAQGNGDIIFDQVFLGMGDDGHTASLFPGNSYLENTEVLVLETRSPKPPFPRVTLGLKTLWQAKALYLIVLGKEKSRMLSRLFSQDKSLPITLALKGHANPVIFLDKAAYETLEKKV